MSPARLEKLESSLRTVLAYTEAYNRLDVPGMLQHLGDDCIFEEPDPSPDGRRLQGKEALAVFLQDQLTRLPQVHLTIEEAFGMGLHCVLLWQREWQESPSVKVHLRGVDIFLVKEGLIQHKYSYIKG